MNESSQLCFSSANETQVPPQPSLLAWVSMDSLATALAVSHALQYCEQDAYFLFLKNAPITTDKGLHINRACNFFSSMNQMLRGTNIATDLMSFCHMKLYIGNVSVVYMHMCSTTTPNPQICQGVTTNIPVGGCWSQVFIVHQKAKHVLFKTCSSACDRSFWFWCICMECLFVEVDIQQHRCCLRFSVHKFNWSHTFILHVYVHCCLIAVIILLCIDPYDIRVISREPVVAGAMKIFVVVHDGMAILLYARILCKNDCITKF